MLFLLLLVAVAAFQIIIGALLTRAGVTTIREQWVLCHRGIRRPAIAERLMTNVGPLAVYRFLDGDCRIRVANAGRLRSLPAVEVEIVYDPCNTTLVHEKPGLLIGAVGAVAVAVGVSVMGLALTGVAMMVGAWR